jgi:hypothetical protein
MVIAKLFIWPPVWGDTFWMRVSTIGATVITVLLFLWLLYGLYRLGRWIRGK